MRRNAVSLLVMAGLFVLILTLGFFQSAQGAEFVADMVMKSPQGTFTGKVWVKGNKMRQEMNMMGMKHISIIRNDKKLVWNLMPQQRAYMEMAARPGQNFTTEEELKEQGRLKYLGTEKVSGYKCKKYRLIPKDPSAPESVMWIANKLKYPIKVVSSGPMGEMEIILKNIKRKKVSDSLFEVPAGYEKMTMPMMMPGMRGQ